jgi:hypothetical protein
MSHRNRRPRPTDVDRGPEFKFIEFNPIRARRGAEAARVDVNGNWLWMSEADVDRNIKMFGRDPELLKAKMAYGIAPPPAFVQQTQCVPPEPLNEAPAAEQKVGGPGGPWAAELTRREYLHQVEEQRADAVKRESEVDQ